MLRAALDFNGDVDKLLVFAEQPPVRLHWFGGVGHDADDGGELARGHLPDVEIANPRIAIALDRAANLLWQVGSLGRAIKEDAAGVAHQSIGPNGHDDTADDAHHGVEPGPPKELACGQGNNRRHRCEGVREDVNVGGAQVQVATPRCASVAVLMSVPVGVGMTMIVVVMRLTFQQPRAHEIDDQTDGGPPNSVVELKSVAGRKTGERIRPP